MEDPTKVDDDSIVTELTLTSNQSFSSPSKNDSYSKVDTSDESASLQSKPITTRFIHKEKYFKLGNTYAFFPDKEGNPRIIIGPNYNFFIGLTSTISLLFLLFFFFLGSYVFPFVNYIGMGVYFFFLFAYGGTFLVNPGYPKITDKTFVGEKGMKFCKVCKIWMERGHGYRHCPECEICVEEYDHHCPWTSKCVGKGNMVFFYLFLLSIFLTMIYLTMAFVFAMEQYTKNIKNL